MEFKISKYASQWNMTQEKLNEAYDKAYHIYKNWMSVIEHIDSTEEKDCYRIQGTIKGEDFLKSLKKFGRYRDSITYTPEYLVLTFVIEKRKENE